MHNLNDSAFVNDSLWLIPYPTQKYANHNIKPYVEPIELIFGFTFSFLTGIFAVQSQEDYLNLIKRMLNEHPLFTMLEYPAIKNISHLVYDELLPGPKLYVFIQRIIVKGMRNKVNFYDLEDEIYLDEDAIKLFVSF